MKTRQVRCTVCGVELVYESDNTGCLLAHLKRSHPNLSLSRFSPMDASRPEEAKKGGFFNAGRRNPKPSLMTATEAETQKKTPGNQLSLKMGEYRSTKEKQKAASPRKPETVYRTTVETWTPGNGQAVTCPKCQFKGQPDIRSTKNKMTKSHLHAFFIMGCWPFMILSSSSQVKHLYCPSCKVLLGTIDRKDGVFKPADSDQPNSSEMPTSSGIPTSGELPTSAEVPTSGEMSSALTLHAI